MQSKPVIRIAMTAALLLGAISLGACSEKRDATAETGNASAEVTTSAPANAVSDADLNAAAVNAVVAADPNGAPFVKDGAGNTTATAPTNTQ